VELDESTSLSPAYVEQQAIIMKYFLGWSEGEQVHFVEEVLSRMCHHQHGQVDLFLKPMLQRDFISALPGQFIPCSMKVSLISSM